MFLVFRNNYTWLPNISKATARILYGRLYAAICRERQQRPQPRRNASIGFRRIQHSSQRQSEPFKGEKLLENAVTHLGLSARADDRILKTIENNCRPGSAENIEAKYLSEAIQYRTLDRSYLIWP
jgi:predicted ATPase with chaperone activity